MIEKTKAYKAQIATALSFVAGVTTFWIADTGAFTPKEIAQAVITSAVSSGIIGGATWWVKNPKE